MDERANSLPGLHQPSLRQQVYLQLRAAIEQGVFTAGARLPASRDHAIALGVSRNTVLWALERLQAEGYVHARVGDGSYVAPGLRSLGKAAPGRALAPLVHGLSRRGKLIADTAMQWSPPTQPATAFRISAPEVQTFPFKVWDRLARQASAAQRLAGAQYLDPAGQPNLRTAIAHWLWASRGIRCSPEQVLVCSGSQQAIDLIGRLLLDPGDEVIVEDPGYHGIRASLLAHGAVVRPAPLDGNGLCIDAAAARWRKARMAVVTPTHQFPTGVHMGLERRLALLGWAQASGSWIVEDDYDGEFQYGTHRLPALCSLPHAQRVLYVGTFSKTLHPGLRMGFVVIPRELAGPFAMAKALTDRHAPGDVQETLARFITDGHLLRHLGLMREIYLARQHTMIRALADYSGGELQLQPSDRGMHLVHELPDMANDTGLVASAAAQGVAIAPVSRYAVESPRRGWLFGYSAFDEKQLRTAARLVGPLAAAALAAIRKASRQAAGR